MRIFLNELRTRHRAKVGALYKRHKSAIGYVILAVGVVIALALGAQAISHSDERAERQAAIICQNTTRTDIQQLQNLVTKSGHELIADFHLSLDKAAVLVHKQLVTSAQERKSLQPSNPASACTSKITVLDISKLHPPATKTEIKALQIASKEPPPAQRTVLRPKKAAAPKVVAAPPVRKRAPAHHRATPVVPHRAPTHHTAPGPVAPVPRPTPPKAGGGTVPLVPPVTTRPPVPAPIPTPETPMEPKAPAPPIVQVPPIKVGPVETPEVKVTVTTPRL